MLALGGLISCEALFHGAVESATDSRINEGPSCQNLKVSCQAQFYREWQDDSGKLTCVCDDYSH